MTNMATILLTITHYMDAMKDASGVNSFTFTIRQTIHLTIQKHVANQTVDVIVYVTRRQVQMVDVN